MPVAHIEAPPQCFTVAEDGTTEEEMDAVLAEDGQQQPSGTVTGAAVLGGAAGLALFGPVAAVAAAGALAYAATRDDKLGDVAKTGGKAVVDAAQKAKHYDAEHVGLAEKASSAYQSAPDVGFEPVAAQLSEQAKVAGSVLVQKAQPVVARAKDKWREFDERNQVSENTVAAAGKTKEAVKEGLNKLSALDEQYEVSKKLQAGVTTGVQTLSGMFKRASAGGARTPHLQAHDLWRHGLHALAPAALAASPQAPATPQ